MQGCDNFKEFTLNSCPDNFIVNTALPPITLFAWELKNKFTRKIQGEIVTDADGIITIPVADSLSKDMFHDFSNAYEFRLYLIDENENRQPFKFCDQYDYLVFVFEDVEPLPDPNNAIITLTC